MHPFLDPTRFGIEFLYTLVVIVLCFFVYHKTKDIYDLTKYKGIGYFRNAFLLFGFAYASRFILHILTFTTRLFFDSFIPRNIIFPLIIIPVGYLSTMAIFYLSYSTVWKKIDYKYFLIFSNTLAILLSAIAFISRSHILLSSLQLLLLLFTIIISFRKHTKGKKRLQTRALYLLISIFWLINLIVVGPRRLLSFETKLILQVISIFVFIVIYHKVTKWIK